MLVLTRKPNERVLIGSDITVMVVSVTGNQVRLGITAPNDVPVHREEVAMRIEQDGQAVERIAQFAKRDESNASQRSVAYNIHGFFATYYLRVRQDKNHKTGKWSAPAITWGSCGRDRDEEPCDVIAAECLAAAIRDACEVASKWHAANSDDTEESEAAE